MTTQPVATSHLQWTTADRLRKAREVAGLSQIELAEATGLSRQTIGNYEQGHTHPRRPALVVWSLATGVAVDWLEVGDEPLTRRKSAHRSSRGENALPLTTAA